MTTRHVILTNGVLKFPSLRLIESTLVAVRPNQNTKIERTISTSLATIKKTL